MVSEKYLKITIFANFLINNKERFLRMKDSYYSFCGIKPAHWIVNVRGKFKKETINFLRENISQKLDISSVESKNGWIHDTKLLSSNIRTDYLMIWVEDHICMAPIDILKKTIKEVIKFQIDHFIYTWHGDALPYKFDNVAIYKKGEFINSWIFNQNSYSRVKNDSGYDPILINLPSIMKTNFFKKILNCKGPLLKRWPKKTPFDFEKKWKDNFSPSFINSRSINELFVAIDDDSGVKGYSLISRGLYPNRLSREDLLNEEYKKNGLIKFYGKLTPQFLKYNLKKVFVISIRILYTLNILDKPSHPPGP